MTDVDKLAQEMRRQFGPLRKEIETILSDRDRLAREVADAQSRLRIAEQARDDFECNWRGTQQELAAAKTQRALAVKMLRERPTAPHPVDQLNKLTKGLLEHAEAEVASLTSRLAEAERKAAAWERQFDAVSDERTEAIASRDALTELLKEAGELLKWPHEGTWPFAVNERRREPLLARIEEALGTQPKPPLSAIPTGAEGEMGERE